MFMIKRIEITLTESEICNMIRIALGVSEKDLVGVELYKEGVHINATIIYKEIS